MDLVGRGYMAGSLTKRKTPGRRMERDSIFLVYKHRVDNASTKETGKPFQVKWRKPFFWDKLPIWPGEMDELHFFGVQTPRGQCQRKEICKTPGL